MTKPYILVAEDDKFYANLYKIKLSAEGFDVAIASDGVQAVELAKQKTPDLTLLDLIMPFKDGFEVLAELRADGRFKNMPIVVLSSLGQEEDAGRAKELGANDYIIKTSISISEMVDKVKQYLKAPSP